MEQKSDIRAFARERRAAIPAEERATLSSAAAGRLATLPECLSAELVAGYFATAEEIDPAPALKTIGALGATIAYPRIAGPGSLTLHAVSGDLDVEDGPFGIRQPTMASPAVDPAEVDVVIVPGVAFDAAGQRVGYGGGYYDRFLPRTGNAFRVGLCFEEQLLGAIPTQEHDVSVDVVVTPKRVVRV